MHKLVLLLAGFVMSPPVALESEGELGTFSDDALTAGFTLSAIRFEVSEGTGQATVVAELKLQGKAGNLSINNPFFDARLASTCNILVYDDSLKLVALVSESLGSPTPALSGAEMDLILVPGRAFGRKFRFQIPRDRIGPETSLYAQAVLLDTAPLWNRPSVQIGDVTSLAQYRAGVSSRVVALSQPIRLSDPQPAPQAPEATRDIGVFISLFRPSSQPDRRNPSRIAARLTNDSDRNVYVTPHLYLPIFGWPEKPTLVLETRDGNRIGIINDQIIESNGSLTVCRLPPGAFIEGEWTYRIPEIYSSVTRSKNVPLALRVIEMPVLTRDPINEPPDVIVSRPETDVFSRLPIPDSNSIEIRFAQ